MITSAIISPCGLFRYTLERTWAAMLPRLGVCMLNPSTADAERNDPTIARLIVRAGRSGFGSLSVVNLFAYRTAYPANLWNRWANAREIIGPDNDLHIRRTARICNSFLVAWGLVERTQRDATVLDLLHEHFEDRARILCLGLTKSKRPLHPLHVAYNVEMVPYSGRYA